MFKVFKYLKPVDWLLVTCCAGFVVLQVFAELKMPEYVSAITLCMKTGAPTSEVWINGAFMLLCALGAAGSLLIVGFFAAFVGARIAKRLREELYDKVTDFSLADVNRFSVATLITRSTNDVTQVQMLFAMGLQFMFRAPIMAVWAIIKLVQYNWQYSALTAVGVGVIVVLSGIVVGYAMPKFKKIQRMTDDINRIMRELLTGVRVVRAYNAERFSEDKFDDANERLTKSNLSVNRALITLNPIINLVMDGVSIGVFWIGAYIIQAQTGAARLDAFGNMMSLTMYAIQVISAFLMLVMTFIMTPRAVIAARRITEVLDVKPSVTDPIAPAAIPETKGEIEFNDVSFRYPDAAEPVLEHISFKAERGQTVAFIGATGSGKTSLINLVPRFYDVTAGSVTVDGVDVRAYAQKDLRQKIGYVPQRATLFYGALAENINYGDLSDKRDETDIRAALDIAQATDFVSEMEGDINAHIAQGGTNVSGGQKQRLCIARALLKKPKILILDDSTSAVDTRTDALIRKAFREYIPQTTKIIIAQRTSSVEDADRIIVMDGGKIDAVGTHKELLGKNAIYTEVFNTQNKKGCDDEK